MGVDLKYSGTELPQVSQTSNSSPSLWFHSGCGGDLTAPTGSLSSPGYPQPYSHSAECSWRILLGGGSRIHLVITDLDMEESSGCRYDYIQLYDGSRAVSRKSLGKFCEAGQGPRIIETNTNVALIKFRSDRSHGGRGFQLHYSTICDTEVTGLSGVIESPNFPRPYPHDRRESFLVQLLNRENSERLRNVGVTFLKY